MNRIVPSFQTSVVIAAALLLQACSLGDGHVVTEDRPAAGFTQLDLATSIPVDVHRAPAFSVAVILDANLQTLLETTVVDDTLSVRQTSPFTPSAGASVEIGMPTLSAAEDSASGDVTVSGFDGAADLALTTSGSGSLSFDGSCGPLDVHVSGSGSMRLTGQGGHLAATVDSSGSLDASGLLAGGGAEVDVDGSGSAKVAVQGDAVLSTTGSGSIDAELNGGTASFSVSGSGSIVWTGDDAIAQLSRSGSGSVERD
jgi:Putative auto-transporter adhesin, head GIN domain